MPRLAVVGVGIPHQPALAAVPVAAAVAVCAARHVATRR